jgi:transposase
MSSSIAKAPALVKFLEKIDATYKNMKDIWIYLDNGPVHKSNLVKKYLEEHPRIKLKFTSPYSPDINPQEQIWGYDRKKFLNNNQFTSAKQLSMKLSWFVRRLEPEVVKIVASLIPIEALLSFQV